MKSTRFVTALWFLAALAFFVVGVRRDEAGAAFLALGAVFLVLGLVTLRRREPGD